MQYQARLGSRTARGVSHQWVQRHWRRSHHGLVGTILRTLRDGENSVGQLWIDQICINQNDSAEKTQRVRMMSWMYRKARETFIRIRDASEETELAFQTAREPASLKGWKNEDISKSLDSLGDPPERGQLGQLPHKVQV